MTMYVDLLSNVVDTWMDKLTQTELVRYARTCRDALHRPGAYGATSNVDVLAAEVAYDRALMRLCERSSIPFDPRSFDSPADARVRIESALRDAGISVVTSPSRVADR